MAAPSGTGNHALQDYQAQVMILEQPNRKRLMMARQEQDSTTLDRNERSLLGPGVPSSRESEFNFGLLTPSASPPNASSLTLSNSPSRLGSMSVTPSFSPGEFHPGPTLYPPLSVVNDPPPFQPQQTFHPAIKYTPAQHCQYLYQEYPQNPQTRQYPITNDLECAKNVSTPARFPEAKVALAPKLDMWRRHPYSHSMDSIDSCDTNDTADFEVLTPGVHWDEPVAIIDCSITDESFTGCYENSTSSPNKDLDLSALGSSIFNLNSLSSQALTDRNLDVNTRLYPFERAETPLKKDSRPQILSEVLQRHEQGTNQFGCIVNESGAVRQEGQIPVSQNRNIASKPNCDEDIRITVEAPPLQSAKNLISNTASEQDLTYYQRQTPSPSSISASGSETCSWSSDNDTDWGDDESDGEHQNVGTPVIIECRNMLAEPELPNLVTKPVLSKMKHELVDRIMVEFWQIFNQEKEIHICEYTISRNTRSHKCQEPDTSPQDEQNTTPTSNSNTKSNVQINGIRPIGDQNGKRKRQGEDDDDENDESKNRRPKRPKGLLSSPRNQDGTSKFACPYRKHDARKYCVQHWRSCALTPLETVARVKGHLYRHHRIFQCQRCKTLFNDQQGVNDHLKEAKGCELLEVVQQDGITNEIVEKLRSKKKAHRNQSEEDRWKEIYHILFPEEMVPSPFFEEIQEDVIQSPDSRELVDYEEYCRRELPRVFRASLEEVVNNNTQPLEEQLRGQLMDLIRDAQDRVFSSYRSSSSTTMETPARGAPCSSPQSITSSSLSQGFPISPPRSQPTINSSRDRSQARLPAFFQPPSPQNHLEFGLDISDRNITPSKPDRNDQSDSGYDSTSLALLPTLPLTPGHSTVHTSTSNFQTLPPLEINQETTDHADNEVARTHQKQYSNVGTTNSGGNGHLDSKFYLSHNTFDFDLDSIYLLDFDIDVFGNCDFS